MRAGTWWSGTARLPRPSRSTPTSPRRWTARPPLRRPMSHDPPRRHMREIPMVYPQPDADQVVTQAGIEYAQDASDPLTLDVYLPARRAAAVALPAIVLVAGYSDVGYAPLLGCRFKDTAM